MTDPTTDDPTITVRPARADDIPGLVASSTALFTEDAGTRDPSVDAHWPRVHADAVVGHLTGSLAEPTAIRPVRTATLISVYVRPAHRSSGAGAGEEGRATVPPRSAGNCATSLHRPADE